MLDALRDITTVAFDKTGTLTKGVFEVNLVLPVPGVSEQALLNMAARVESRSSHPLARAIVLAAQGTALRSDTALPLEVCEVPGKGLYASCQGEVLLVGNSALLAAHGIAEEAFLTTELRTLLDTEAGSVVHVARDAVYLGTIVVSDVIRHESAAAVQALRDQGIRQVVMLTGDRVGSAEPVAR
ncbi:MAG: HAD family hydrolase, partial [Bilophila sp.]